MYCTFGPMSKLGAGMFVHLSLLCVFVTLCSGTPNLCEKVKDVAAATFCEELEEYPAGHESDENLIQTGASMYKIQNFKAIISSYRDQVYSHALNLFIIYY